MSHKEYPKALYRAGTYLEVADHAAEVDARAEGFKDWAADHYQTADEPAPEVKAQEVVDSAPEAEPQTFLHSEPVVDAKPTKRAYTKKAK